LARLITQYGAWTYLILLVIVFCETGPGGHAVLPGDSLLFAAGAFAASGVLDPLWLFFLLSAAAIAGDTVNYWIGALIGPRAFSGNIRFLKKEYLERTHAFYEKYGGKTIIIARFVPIVRTFAPFVAGVGAMNYAPVHRLQHHRRHRLGGIVRLRRLLVRATWSLSRRNSRWSIPGHRSLSSVMPMVVEYLRSRRQSAQ